MASLKLKTQDSVLHILLIEDHADYAHLLAKRLSKTNHPSLSVEHVERLDEGLEHIRQGGIDVVLLDLFLPDSQGLDTFLKFHEQAPEMPIVVLTGLKDETLGVEAVQKGAQDFLIKGEVTGKGLIQALRFAVERGRARSQLTRLALTDELTGLYNRRGFFAFVEQQLKLAKRNHKKLLLIFLDLDGLKQINDTHGHQEGDRALRDVAQILKTTFREPDVIARIGGDEFSVLAEGAGDDGSQVLLSRLQEKHKDYCEQMDRKFKLSLSMGVTTLSPDSSNTVEQLLTKADRIMYRYKKRKQTQSPSLPHSVPWTMLMRSSW